MKSSGNTILVTGGGSGIGRALAQRWHDAGNKVIVAGRRVEALEQTIAGRDGMSAIQLDVESPEAIKAFARELISTHRDLNVLVNNAGIMRREDTSAGRNLNDAEQTIVTNLLGPIRLTDALIDHLKDVGNGAVVNVTSGLAFVPLPATATYSATKAAMHSYSQSLRQQLKGAVEVIELAPPGVQTDLTPGQATNAAYQPLEEFADEVMSLLASEPTPAEILVQRVKPLRFAERDGTYPQMLEMLSAH